MLRAPGTAITDSGTIFR